MGVAIYKGSPSTTTQAQTDTATGHGYHYFKGKFVIPTITEPVKWTQQQQKRKTGLVRGLSEKVRKGNVDF